MCLFIVWGGHASHWVLRVMGVFVSVLHSVNCVFILCVVMCFAMLCLWCICVSLFFVFPVFFECCELVSYVCCVFSHL